MKTRLGWTRWAPLLLLAGVLGACGGAAVPKTTEEAAAPAPLAQPAEPAPAEPQATCDDLAIRLLDHGPGIHGAIVADTLHLGGATAPVTCSDPANQSVAGWSIPDDWTAQAQQSQYYLIVVRYPGGNRIYVVSRRSDGTTCIVNTNDQCVAEVSDLPDDFDLSDLPDDVAPTIPAGQEAPEEPAAPPTPAAPDAPEVVPAAPGNPRPRNEATGVTVDAPRLSWSAARASSYDLYWGTTKDLAADAALGTPITTSYTPVAIRRPGATAAERRLAHETTYYWRVDAKNYAGTTRGDVWSFTTAAAAAAPVVTDPAPDAAANLYPRDGATGVNPVGLTLSWSAARATSYDLYWGTTQPPSMSHSTPGTVVRFGKDRFGKDILRGETTYYWRIDAKNDAGTTRGSVWSFTTAAKPAAADPAPDAAVNLYPRNGATGVTPASWRRAAWSPLDLHLRWSAARATSYDVYLGTTRNLAADDRIHSSYKTSVVGPVVGETTYYWRVDAKNDTGTTRGSVWSFTTGAEPPGGTLWIDDASWVEGNEGQRLERKIYIYWRDHEHLRTTRTRYNAEATDITATGVSGESRRYGRPAHPAHPSHVKSGDDYGFYSGGFLAHVLHQESAGYLSLYFVGDNIKEEDETFRVTITPRGRDVWPHDYGPVVTCGRCTATITILNDD